MRDLTLEEIDHVSGACFLVGGGWPKPSWNKAGCTPPRNEPDCGDRDDDYGHHDRNGRNDCDPKPKRRC